MDVYLIRHCLTKGSKERRYVGKTDESLLPGEECKLQELKRDLFRELNPDSYEWNLYVSPLKRCRETAEVLFPKKLQIINSAFQEVDYGDFEYKSVQDLADDADYQAWIATEGEISPPNGEDKAHFRKRIRAAFIESLWDAHTESCEAMVVLAHMGTIMAILDEFAVPHRYYYDWQMEAGQGYQLLLRDLEIDDCKLHLVRAIPDNPSRDKMLNALEAEGKTTINDRRKMVIT